MSYSVFSRLRYSYHFYGQLAGYSHVGQTKKENRTWWSGMKVKEL